jgi:group I intron endonuclease
MWYIYLITNMVNGSLYVGKGRDVSNRWSKHKSIARGGKEKYPNHFRYFHAAIAKYGIDNFRLSILNSYNIEQDALNSEKSYIAQFRADGYILYNLTDGGEGTSGIRVSNETKQKRSLAMKGKLIGHKNPRYGKTHSDESKHKMSLAHKGHVVSKETRHKLSLLKIGSNHTETTKKYLSSIRRCENNPHAKLTKEDVTLIRIMYSDGVSQIEISKIFDVKRQTISQICLYKTWKEI